MSHNYSGRPPVTSASGGLTSSSSINPLAGPSEVDGGAIPELPISKKRKPARVKVGSEVKRSSSTPHIRNLALADAGTLSPTSDKRRNKLGYHRSSVACAHCRRRKIRCLVATDDSRGRCSNCIRLKKECQFLPIEHQGIQERRRSATGGAGMTADAIGMKPDGPPTSGLSSPKASTRSTHDSIDNLDESTIPKVPGHSYESDSAYGEVPLNEALQAPYPYPQPPKSASWIQSDFQAPQNLVEDGIASGFWPSSSDGIAPMYHGNTPVSGAVMPNSARSSVSHGFTHPDDRQSWGQARSMSFSHVENLPYYQQFDGRQNQPPTTFPNQYQLPFDAASLTSAPAVEGLPVSAPLGQTPVGFYQQPFSFPNPNIPAAQPILPSQQSYPSTTWPYPEPSPLEKVDEEQTPGNPYAERPSYFHQVSRPH